MSAHKSHRILIIEDNQDAARSLHTLLSLEGHDSRMVHSGPDGLAAMPDFRPGVVMCDIGLPGMDGYQFIRLLRENPAYRTIHAIAMSGYGRADDIKLAYESGFDLHMTKPVDYHKLRHTLADLA